MRVQLFRVVVLTFRAWLGTVRFRIRVECALNERGKDVRDEISEWGGCFR